MKKQIMYGLLAFLVFIGNGCITANVIKPLPTQELIIKVQNDTGAKVDVDKKAEINKTMSIPYTDPEFSGDAIRIGDMVCYSIWGGISAYEPLNFKKTLEVMKYKGIKKMKLFINSGGGSAFDGLAVSDMMEKAIKNGIEINTEASGLIASASVPIFGVGQYRMATRGTMFMVHSVKLFKLFSQEGKSDLRAQHKMMTILEDRYNSVLENHSKLSRKEWSDKCEKTTWFTSEEALEWGLVDEIL